MLNKILIGSWLLVICFLFLYSFTQIDLGLTLARASIFQALIKNFQYVGWFNRPLSTLLYCSIIILLAILYCWTLFLVWTKKIRVKTVVIITVISSVILLFSYNAFSYDLFNYIFDAKIVTHYHQNPYQHKALDYSEDAMLGFMHWTHRTFPYGPLWLGLTIPLSYLGLGYFLPTLYLIKLLVVGSYLLTCFFIYKIARKTKLADPAFAFVFFALNPFVLIEALVSAHIDMVMMAAAMWAVYLLMKNKKLSSWMLFLASILIKFATALLLPLFIWYPISRRKNKDFVFIFASIILMLVGVYLQVVLATKTFQPWYFLLVVPFAALLANKYYISIPTILFSFLVLLQYVPYLYTGNYNPPIPQLMNQMLLGSIGISIIPILIIAGLRRAKK